MASDKNILVVVIDCLRADHAYGDYADIPNIKRLREEGFFFENTIASTTTTTPSFSSLLTGMYPFENGVRSHSGYSLSDDLKTIPQLLQEAGYNTYAEATGPLGLEVGLDRGFDEYNHRDRKKHLHTTWGRDFLKRIEEGHYKEPWFILFHVWPLHTPRVVLKECDNDSCGKTNYARALSSIDRYLGRLFNLLDENTLIIISGDHGEQFAKSDFDRLYKRAKKKAIRFLLDKGILKTPFSKAIRNVHIGHGYGLYDSLVRIPLIFHNRDLIKPGSTKVQVRQIDTLPTVLDLMGIKYFSEISGKSVVPIMDNKDTKHRDAFMEAVGVAIPRKEDWVSGIRVDNKYKYIYSPFRDDFDEELYDLESDPNERKNIAKKKKNIVDDLKQRIEGLKTEQMVGKKMGASDEEEVMARLKDLGYMD